MTISDEIIVTVINLLMGSQFLIYLSLPFFIGLIPAKIARLNGRESGMYYFFGILLSSIITITNISYNMHILIPPSYDEIYRTGAAIIIGIIIIQILSVFLIKPPGEYKLKARLWLHPSVVRVFVFCIIWAALPSILSYCDARIYPTPTYLRKPSIEVPFEVHRAGAKAESEFWIRTVDHTGYARGYYFGLYYRQGDAGVPTPLRLTITMIDTSGEHPIHVQIVQGDPKELKTISARGSRLLQIARVELQPGRYRASLENLKDVPELAGIPVKFAIYREIIWL